MSLDPRINARLASDLQTAEKDSLVAYKDSLGNWTIGRGHLLPAAAPGQSWAGFTISQDVSDRYFSGDILSAIGYAQNLPEFASCDTVCRQNALIELCFNMRGKWHTFVKTRAAIQAQDWQTAHDELLHSLWEHEVHETRANRIADQFLNGEYA